MLLIVTGPVPVIALLNVMEPALGQASVTPPAFSTLIPPDRMRLPVPVTAILLVPLLPSGTVIAFCSVTVESEPPRLRVAVFEPVVSPSWREPVPRTPLVPEAGLASRIRLRISTGPEKLLPVPVSFREFAELGARQFWRMPTWPLPSVMLPLKFK